MYERSCFPHLCQPCWAHISPSTNSIKLEVYSWNMPFLLNTRNLRCGCVGTFLSCFHLFLLLIPNPQLSPCRFQLKHGCFQEALRDHSCLECELSLVPSLFSIFSAHDISWIRTHFPGRWLDLCLPASSIRLWAPCSQGPMVSVLATVSPAPRTDPAHSRCSVNIGGLESSEYMFNKIHAKLSYSRCSGNTGNSGLN